MHLKTIPKMGEVCFHYWPKWSNRDCIYLLTLNNLKYIYIYISNNDLQTLDNRQVRTVIPERRVTNKVSQLTIWSSRPQSRERYPNRGSGLLELRKKS